MMHNCRVTQKLSLALLLSLVLPVTVLAEKRPSAEERESKREISGGPYCGIYCVYAALRLQELEVDFRKLADVQYVGSFFGSSLAELKKAVEDHGGHAQPMEGLTATALRAASDPIILHVRRPGYKTTFAHWILFLGVEGDRARIVDPPNTVELLPLDELLSLWDGTGLIVTREPTNTLPLRVAGWTEQAVVFLLVAFSVGLLRLATNRMRASRRWVAVPVGLVSLSVGLALLCHLLRDEGFLRSRAALAQVAGQHFKPAIPEYTIEDVVPLVNTSDVTLLDARFGSDYERGHLPGAISLPIYAGLVERAEVLTNVPKSNRVVVYCQSESCGWAEVIAADLVHRGYKDVVLFPGGFIEWQQHEQARKKK